MIRVNIHKNGPSFTFLATVNFPVLPNVGDDLELHFMSIPAEYQGIYRVTNIHWVMDRTDNFQEALKPTIWVD